LWLGIAVMVGTEEGAASAGVVVGCLLSEEDDESVGALMILKNKLSHIEEEPLCVTYSSKM
jgi:hypothetical protein